MEKIDYVGIGLGILALLTLFLWLNSWQPVHATCYVDENNKFNRLEGERRDYYGFQKQYDSFLNIVILRGQVTIVKQDDIIISEYPDVLIQNLEHTGFDKGKLWRECTRW